MWGRKVKKQRPGRPVEVRTLRQMAEAADWSANIQANPPLSIASMPGGPLFRLASMLLDVRVAISTTSISYRVGGAPGSGTIKLKSWNGTTLVDLPGPVTRTAYNISSNAAGIGVGKFCIVIKIAGSYFIITSEC